MTTHLPWLLTLPPLLLALMALTRLLVDLATPALQPVRVRRDDRRPRPPRR